VWADLPVDSITFVADGNGWETMIGRVTETVIPS
jgi:hypothetical protein